jgi:hypothetical protein
MKKCAARRNQTHRGTIYLWNCLVPSPLLRVRIYLVASHFCWTTLNKEILIFRLSEEQIQFFE